MDPSTPGLRLESLTPPRREISRIWRALRQVDCAFIRFIIGDAYPPKRFSASFTKDGTTTRAFAQVVLLAIEGHSYVEALLAETIRSLDYVREVRRGRMRGSPHLLQIWLRAHIRPFCSSHPFSYITDDCSLIACLLTVFHPPERTFSEWRQFLEELTPTQFLWAARWNPDGPMIMGCSGIIGLPLLSHLGSTLVFPSQVIRQLGGLQDIPTEADLLVYRILWADSHL
ncbi:hypothetical protein CRG98_023098 [Punica granatum]|uniref:DUF7745 domain-containing protein n=1 Tax=Punica granatum TaxID=22663 RepID=A0A2I0JKI9_PUNGR|nr:hypothetical protein CRG98_023098 [Punica granatum]